MTSREADVVELPSLEVTGEKIATESASGTRALSPILETPQSLSVITRAELDLRGVQRLTEAVAYTAGVQTESFGIDSRTDTLTIRGYDAGGFTNNIYLDGLRGSAGGTWTRSQFDTFGLERVEVLKGPSAVLYGAVEPGGVVNSVSKRPGLGLADTVSVQFSTDTGLQGTFDLSGANGDTSLLYRVVGLARDGESQIDHVDLSRVFIAPSLTWNIGERTRITFLTSYQEDDGGSTYQFLPQTGTLKPGANGYYFDTSTFLGEPDWNLFERTQYGLGYQLEHLISEQVTLHQSLRYGYLDTDFRGIVGTPVDADFTTGSYNRRAAWGYGESDNLMVDTHAMAKFSTGEFSHTLLGGVDFLKSDWDHTRVIAAAPPINIYDPVYSGYDGSAIRAAAPQSAQEVTEQQTGLYLQNQAARGPLHATVGVRHDLYDIDYADAVSPATNVQQKPDATTWRAGLLYATENGIAPYVSYATSFSAAPFTQLGTDGLPLGNPIESEQFEAGIKYQPKDLKALFTVSGFRLVEEGRLLLVSRVPTLQYNQVSEATTQGLEFEGRAELFAGLSIVASYTYLDSEISTTAPGGAAVGNRLALVPESMASGWLSYDFKDGPARGLTVGGGVRYVGSTFGNDANTIEVPSYTLFDASIGYELGQSFPALQGTALRLSATNLADKRYVVNSTAPGAAWYGSGRNVVLSVRYAW